MTAFINTVSFRPGWGTRLMLKRPRTLDRAPNKRTEQHQSRGREIPDANDGSIPCKTLANIQYLWFFGGGVNGCRAGPRGWNSHRAAERILAARGDSACAVRRDTSEAPPRQPPHTQPSFIWEYDLYFLKWRVLNPAIKELRGLPWACHSNESMAGIWGLFNRAKLVFTMPQTGIWRNLSGGEERAS